MIATAIFFLAAVMAIGASNIADAIRESNSIEDEDDDNDNENDQHRHHNDTTSIH